MPKIAPPTVSTLKGRSRATTRWPAVVNRTRKWFRPSGFHPCATRTMTGSPLALINVCVLWNLANLENSIRDNVKAPAFRLSIPPCPLSRARRISYSSPRARALAVSRIVRRRCQARARRPVGQRSVTGGIIGRRESAGDRQWGGARDRNSTIELSAKIRWRSGACFPYNFRIAAGLRRKRQPKFLILLALPRGIEPLFSP